uniref:Uncharacterized protein n=1 Tax=Anopheles albimanus TaxID=7167 RepID=A0A182FWG9_ANOAL
MRLLTLRSRSLAVREPCQNNTDASTHARAARAQQPAFGVPSLTQVACGLVLR